MPVRERVIYIWLFCASTLGLRCRSTHFPIHAPMRERAQRAGGTACSGPHDGGWLVEVEVEVEVEVPA